MKLWNYENKQCAFGTITGDKKSRKSARSRAVRVSLSSRGVIRCLSVVTCGRLGLNWVESMSCWVGLGPVALVSESDPQQQSRWECSLGSQPINQIRSSLSLTSRSIWSIQLSNLTRVGCCIPRIWRHITVPWGPGSRFQHFCRVPSQP